MNLDAGDVGALAISGGTLTGSLSATSATFSGGLTIERPESGFTALSVVDTSSGASKIELKGNGYGKFANGGIVLATDGRITANGYSMANLPQL